MIAARFDALQKTYESLFKTFTDLKQEPIDGQNSNVAPKPTNSRIITFNNPSNSANPTLISKRPVKISQGKVPTTASKPLKILTNLPIIKQPSQKYLVPVSKGNLNRPILAQNPTRMLNNITSRTTIHPVNPTNLPSRTTIHPVNPTKLPSGHPNPNFRQNNQAGYPNPNFRQNNQAG